MTEATHAYLGIYSGHVEAICVDRQNQDTADFLAEIVREGGIIERVTIEEARNVLFEPHP